MKFNRIWVKVFLILAVLNASLALAVYLFSLWSFDRSLNRYNEEQRQLGMVRLAGRLAESYVQRNGWDEIVRDPSIVEELIFNTLFDESPPHGPDPLTEPPPPRHERDDRLPMGIFLRGANGEQLLGEEGWFSDAAQIPIRVQNRTVGYLGAPPSRPLPPMILQAFAEQQRQSFLLIALGMLGVSVFGAFGIARWFGRPIGALAQGTQTLIRGDCSIRLPCHSQDELGQLAQDFNTLAHTLAANRESRREWIVNISHELRTPLTVMRGEIEAIEDGIRQPDADWHRRIGQKTRQLSVLVNDLHQLALSDQGALIFHKARINLVSLIRELLDSHRSTFEHIGLQVNLDAGKEVLISGDIDRLCQLFGNLLQNTLRYTDMPGHLQLRIWTKDNRAHLSWEDSSPGVPPATLERLTDRLYRGDDSRNRAAGGSGLGLSIAKAIVDAHEGSMQASLSALGGLCWSIQLPQVQEMEYA